MQPVDVNWTRPEGISGAELWVTDTRARRADPAGFDADCLAVDRSTGRRPCLVAMPGRLDQLEGRVAAYRAAGAPGVVRICPGPEGHGYPLEAWALSPLPEYCEREELALVIDLGATGTGFPWAAVVRFARLYPRLPMTALGAPLDGPTAGRALDATPNLVLETSALYSVDVSGFAGLVRSHGAYRFAYGSGAGRSDAASIADSLDTADAEQVLAGTAGHLADRTWGSTYL